MVTNVLLLYILLGLAAAAVVFTFVFVILADRSLAKTRDESATPAENKPPETDREANKS